MRFSVLTLDEAWAIVRSAKDATEDEKTWTAVNLIENHCKHLKNPRFCRCGAIIARPEIRCDGCAVEDARERERLKREYRERLAKAKKLNAGLASRSSYIMERLRAGDGYEDIAEKLNVSRQRVYCLARQAGWVTKIPRGRPKTNRESESVSPPQDTQVTP